MTPKYAKPIYECEKPECKFSTQELYEAKFHTDDTGHRIFVDLSKTSAEDLKAPPCWIVWQTGKSAMTGEMVFGTRGIFTEESHADYAVGAAKDEHIFPMLKDARVWKEERILDHIFGGGMDIDMLHDARFYMRRPEREGD